MICHARPIHEDALGALKNPFVDQLAENMTGGIYLSEEKRATDQKKIESMFP